MKKLFSFFCTLVLVLSITTPALATSTSINKLRITTVQEIAEQEITPQALELNAEVDAKYPGLKAVPLDEIDPSEEIIVLDSVDQLDQIMSSLSSAPYYRTGYDVSEHVDNYLDSIVDEIPSTPIASFAYGDAPAYQIETSRNINCYGYAADFPFSILPGDIYYTNGSPWKTGSTVLEVADWVEKDFSRANRPIRRITSFNASVTSSERRIATRVGDKYVSLGGTTRRICDFHFMRQTNTGRWAHKPGANPSIYTNIINPTTASWDLYSTSGTPIVTNFYDSTTIYFAI